MLIALEVSNFAIVSQLSTEWSAGMTTITGETGAGKSIAIDALSLCLGERSEAAMVRPGSEKAEVTAQFDIRHLPKAKAFLAQHDLLSDDECILRRVISHTGRSKAYINGSAVTASQLKSLSQLLIAIHGQHAHQLLSKNEHQLQLLDEYAGHFDLLNKTNSLFKQYQSLKKEHAQLLQLQQQQQAQQQLLEYQVAELDDFALEPGEYELVESEHSLLSHTQTLLESSQRELQHLYDEDNGNAYSLVQHSANTFAELAQIDPQLSPVADLLFEAAVQIEDAAAQIRRYQEKTECDPNRLNEVEDRMAKTLELARKHHIRPEELAEFHTQLVNSLTKISHDSKRLEQLDSEIESTKEEYYFTARQLSDSREAAATELNQLISNSMQTLSMENGVFEIALHFDADATPSASGADKIDFMVCTNPGQPIQPLAKVASGGELSRISLAIQVIIAAKVTTPTLIFDEVDVGISGPTASAVGLLLRQLGESTQVICVTHLPQVACSGHHQFFVAKFSDGQQTHTQMRQLDEQGRINEIARLLGGNNISQTTLSNAQELLAACA